MWPGDEGVSTCLLQNKVKSYLDVGYDIKVDKGCEIALYLTTRLHST